MTGRQRALLASIALGCALATAACGVVSGPSPAATETTTTSEVAAESPSTGSADSGGAASAASADAAALPAEWVDAVALLDAARVAAGAERLTVDAGLSALAQHQAEHYGTGAEQWDGDFGADLASAGYAHGSARIGSGPQSGAVDAIEHWLDSTEQAEPLLDGQFRHLGVGSAPWQGEQWIYVVVVAYRADDGSIPSGSDGAQEVLVATNIERARAGLAGLSLDDRLNAAAQAQADHQADILEMTHEGGGGLSTRVAAAGYEARVAAENVAVGYPSIAEVVAGWIDSPGHYENMMNPDVTQMGFAVAFGSDGRAYYAQVFAAPF